MRLFVFINSFELAVIFVVLLVVAYFWFFRIRRLISGYLNALCDLVHCPPKTRYRWLPFYSRNEIAGLYKTRELVGGIRYLGRGLEWMPLPYIKIKLKEVIRYNYRRLPYFAKIEHGWLVLHITENLPWGLLDKRYRQFFTKQYLVIMLERLVAVAEDVERGRTMGEIFKEEA